MLCSMRSTTRTRALHRRYVPWPRPEAQTGAGVASAGAGSQKVSVGSRRRPPSVTLAAKRRLLAATPVLVLRLPAATLVLPQYPLAHIAAIPFTNSVSP